MHKYFKDYFWKEGIPYGANAIDEPSNFSALSYKIVMDPYRKHISIESYLNGQFSTAVYDSVLLDFRHLKVAAQTAWQKSVIHDNQGNVNCIIRNQDDRILFLESHFFQQGFCRECRVLSVHGIALSTHRMFYTALGDHFNGVILFDRNSHPVMLKRYDVDGETGEFTQLLKEDWNMSVHQQKQDPLLKEALLSIDITFMRMSFNLIDRDVASKR